MALRVGETVTDEQVEGEWDSDVVLERVLDTVPETDTLPVIVALKDPEADMLGERLLEREIREEAESVPEMDGDPEARALREPVLDTEGLLEKLVDELGLRERREDCVLVPHHVKENRPLVVREGSSEALTLLVREERMEAVSEVLMVPLRETDTVAVWHGETDGVMLSLGEAEMLPVEHTVPDEDSDTEREVVAQLVML